MSLNEWREPSAQTLLRRLPVAGLVRPFPDSAKWWHETYVACPVVSIVSHSLLLVRRASIARSVTMYIIISAFSILTRGETLSFDIISPSLAN